MPKQTRINILSNAVSKPREETRNGRKVVVVSSATMPDGIVMNDIRYPGDEITKALQNEKTTLERAPAPLGHPRINSIYVSARDPEGINHNWIGAWNENVRQENGRVLLDKVIDVEVANRTEAGRGLMTAINEGQPIHTSTGLLANLEDAPENSGAKFIAKDIEFDHDAILLNEKGAATPEQGVGMFVNSTGEKVEVINSCIEDSAMCDLEWAADMAVRAVEKLERTSIIERVTTAIKDALTSKDGGTLNTNSGESEMPVSEEQFNTLSGEVKAITESLGKIGEQIANAVKAEVKPLTDNLEEIKANQKAKDDAELDGLREKIVKANLLDEESAKDLTLNAARALAKKAEPGKAAGINNSDGGSSDDDEFTGVDLNAEINGKDK